MTFSDFYHAVCEALKEMGEVRTPDRGTVEDDHAQEMTPQESAKAFYDDWN